MEHSKIYKGKLIRNVNVRIGEASVNAELGNRYYKGREVEALYRVKGKEHRESDEWVYLNDDTYIWGGAVQFEQTPPLLDTNMFIFSTRKKFRNSGKLNIKGNAVQMDCRSINLVNHEDYQSSSLNEVLKSIKASDKVLLIVHGFLINYRPCLRTYNIIAKEYHQHVWSSKNSYNRIIGLIWPGGKSPNFTSWWSVKNTCENKEHQDVVFNLIQKLSAKCGALDLQTFSMGNRLLLDTFTTYHQKLGKPIRNFFSMAGAYDRDSVEKPPSNANNKKKDDYAKASTHCENFYVFHSKRDKVLKSLYRIAEGMDSAIGLHGPEDEWKFWDVSYNHRVIDAQHVVKRHIAAKPESSGTSDGLYRHIRKILDGHPDGRKREFTIPADG